MTKDCTNCGWGVRWEFGVWDGELVGVCQWVPPVSVKEILKLRDRSHLTTENVGGMPREHIFLKDG